MIVAHQQDRQARRQAGARAHRTAAARGCRSRSLGGDVVDVEVSAKNKTNLDKLLEMIALQAELLDLKTNVAASRRRHRDRSQARSRPRSGRHRAGSARHAAGSATSSWPAPRWAASARLSTIRARPSTRPDRRFRSKCSASTARRKPATASPWSRTKPAPARSRATAPTRSARTPPPAISGMRGSLEQMMSQLKTSGRKEFPLIIKADVQGSLEAILGSLDKLGTDEVAARILHAGVGGISGIRRDAGGRFQRRHHRLQRPRPQGSAPPPPSATASKSATTTSSTISSTT